MAASMLDESFCIYICPNDTAAYPRTTAFVIGATSLDGSLRVPMNIATETRN